MNRATASNPDIAGLSSQKLLTALWHSLTPARRRGLGLTLIVMLLAGGTEFLSLYALRNFLAVLIRAPLATQLAGPALIFALSVVAVAAARLFTLRLHDGLVLDFVSDASVEIFERAIRQPYLRHVERESAELFAAIENMQRLVNNALGPLVQAMVNIALAAAVLAYLLILAPYLVLPLLALLALSYAVMGGLTGRRLQSGSVVLQSLTVARLKLLREADSGFRDLVLAHRQAEVLADFQALEARYRARQAHARFVATAPRYLIEMAVVLTVIAFACYSGTRPGGITASLPLIGVVALGIQRLMPLLNSCYSGWGQFQAHGAILANVLNMMRRSALPTADPAVTALPYEDAITLEGVGLRYGRGETVLHDIDLSIRKGERIGIVGASGSGKSSLLDIILGLVEPSEGRILVDTLPIDSHERRWAWQKNLACVAQTPYFPDASIRDLIVDAGAGGVVDAERFARAIQGAGLEILLAALPMGADTRMGDSGLLLSGGQRQRVAIARALYREARMLVLDEATSQLDAPTERDIVDSLGRLGRDMTILIVAHRAAALRGCDRILEIRGGTIVQIGGTVTA